ncbi:MAG: mannose-1-phosphate guanylyltransferase [Planctomycetota bacterium]
MTTAPHSKSSLLHAVILAGGSGTRFWPKSRKARPKHLLPLVTDQPLIAEAASRLAGLVTPAQTWVITTEMQAPAVRESLPELPPSNVIAEPCGRDTAAAMGFAAATVRDADPSATICFMPADHVIRTDESFQATITRGLALLEANPAAVVTIGIPPTFPATGFGYIERGEPIAEVEGAHHVTAFREKPDRETAERYLATGRYAWNAGIFLWRAEALLEALRRFLPSTAQLLDGPAAERAAGYPTLEKISIDFAILEKHEQVLTVEASFQWSDVGAWPALPELFSQDESGNTALGARLAAIDTEGTLVSGPKGKVIATIGLKDLIIVDTEDALLVCTKEHAQKVKEMVGLLGAEGLDAVL